MGLPGPPGPPGTTGPQGPEGPQGETGETLDWSDVIAESRISEAVYAVGFRFRRNPEDTLYTYRLVGTAFAAHYTDALWTNGHAVTALPEFVQLLDSLNLGPPEFFAVQSGSVPAPGEDGTFAIVGEGWVHPDYDGTPFTEDIGLLSIDGEVPVGLKLLPKEMVNDIDLGQPVGTLGYPGELGFTGGEAEDRASPTFKDGVISALRAIDEGESQHVEVQYNFGTTGGTSGSPVFDHDGWVVAVNHAGIERRVEDIFGRVARIPIGGLDFGIRVDEVWESIEFREADESQPPVTTFLQPDYPSGLYRPLPDDWNGRTRGLAGEGGRR